MPSDTSGFFFDFLFGGIAATITKTIMAPIERIQVLLQTQDVNVLIQQGKTLKYKGINDCMARVIKEEGPFALWRGNLSNILRYFPTQAFNFALKDSFKIWFCPYESQKNPWKFFIGSLFSGGLAGSVSVVITYPLDFIRTRLAADIGKSSDKRQFKGIADCVRKVHKTDGVKGIYRGVSISAVMYFFYRAIYFGGYDTIKKVLLVDRKNNLVMMKVFAALMVTNVAGFLVFPLDTVRRRLMMQSGRKHVMYEGSLDCVKKIYREEGVKAFYKGGLSNVLRGSGSAFILVIYDEFQRIWSKKKY